MRLGLSAFIQGNTVVHISNLALTQFKVLSIWNLHSDSNLPDAQVHVLHSPTFSKLASDQPSVAKATMKTMNDMKMIQKMAPV